MAHVSVTVNGRSYEISCDDGEEDHLFRLAQQVDSRVASLVASVGQVGDALLLLLASLLMADQVEELQTELARVHEGAHPTSLPGPSGLDADATGEQLRGLAERIEAMAERLASERAIAETPGPS